MMITRRAELFTSLDAVLEEQYERREAVWEEPRRIWDRKQRNNALLKITRGITMAFPC